MLHSKVSKWPEQHPAPGENPFEFVLVLATLHRDTKDDATEMARIRRQQEYRRSVRIWD